MEGDYWLRVTEPKPKQAGPRTSALSGLHGIVTTVISKEKENERRKKKSQRLNERVEDQPYREL